MSKRMPDAVVERGLDLARWLAAKYPIVRAGQPLAIGVHLVVIELAAPMGYEVVHVKAAMALLTGRQKYLQALAHGGHRFTLDGRIAGVVDQKDMDQARSRIEWRVEMRRQRLEEAERAAKEAELERVRALAAATGRRTLTLKKRAMTWASDDEVVR